ncbi:MAG: hypothetical protein GX601_16090, partial [Anaerolineales bacterium]|nr:hypothetical protein [Anaerolineales bacterium]
ALANSYNVPAVSALQFVGVDGLLDIATRLGVVSLAHPEQYCPEYPYDSAPTYGLALTLGGGEVQLLEMTNAFGAFANGGFRMTPSPILRIEDTRGTVLVDNSTPIGERAISAEHAFLITSILADTRARCRAFACPNALELSRPAAAKTGTTNDYRDAWTVGYTPDIVTGVWVGNSDNSEMAGVAGAAAAAPIWHTFMEAAHADLPVRDFQRPAGVVEHEICADSGARPSAQCLVRKQEVFAQEQPPLDESHDWYQMVKIDSLSGLLAGEHCPDHVIEQLMVVVRDPRGREWVQAHPEAFRNLPLAPLEACAEGTVRAEVVILQPAAGSTVRGIAPIVGTVGLPDFDHYDVQYGVGDNPQGWGWISGPHLAQVREGPLAEWDTTHLAPGLYTLRITAYNRNQQQVEARVQVYVDAPTATPTSEPTATPTVALSPTPTETEVPPTEPPPTATETPTVEVFPTPTEAPTETPTGTVAPSESPTPEATATTGG